MNQLFLRFVQQQTGLINELKVRPFPPLVLVYSYLHIEPQQTKYKNCNSFKISQFFVFLLAKEDKLVGVLPLPEADCFHERRHRNHSASCVRPHASRLKSSVWKQSARQPFNLQPAASDSHDGADLLRHTPTTNNDTLSGR